MNGKHPPEWLAWIMTFINRIGFPILVSLFLGYMLLSSVPKIIDALNEVKVTMIHVEYAIKENTDVLRTWRGPREK